MACLSSEQTTESLWSFNSLTDAFISPLVYVTNSSLQLELKYFFLQLLNVEFMEYLDNCSCTVQFAQKTTDVWLITHLGMLNKEVRVNRWIYKCVCVCVSAHVFLSGSIRVLYLSS